ADRRTERVLDFSPEVDELWRRCLPKKPCTVRKDRRYLDWRYRRAPHGEDYEFLTCRHGGRLAGVLVLRLRSELVPDSAAIVDRVWHDDDDATAAALLAAACRRATEIGRSRVLAMFAPGSPESDHLLARGFTAVPSSEWLERRLTFRITGPYVTPELLATHWRYSLGDTDLV
ncbi:MAG: hypothetical protein KDC98_11790, partial [Planctomycetes bacterium]|nr:hypothetical protein [Planctomycetota bacterium]